MFASLIALYGSLHRSIKSMPCKFSKKFSKALGIGLIEGIAIVFKLRPILAIGMGGGDKGNRKSITSYCTYICKNLVT